MDRYSALSELVKHDQEKMRRLMVMMKKVNITRISKVFPGDASILADVRRHMGWLVAQWDGEDQCQ